MTDSGDVVFTESTHLFLGVAYETIEKSLA
jgi:hypothetical protein